MSGEPDRHEWRADIQGLRAVAVGLVVIYHAAPGQLTGGYVGVDVFFVISGFLITGLLVAELERNGKVAFGEFYARRIRRLLPASLLVIAVTIVAAKVMLAPLDMPSVARDAETSAVYVSNIRYAVDSTNYLQTETPSPLLHYWSLGVEEQFYLVWPALLLLAAVIARRRSLTGFAIVMGVVAVAGFTVSIWLTDREAPYAFFLLPARAWEFALGALVALAVPLLRRLPSPAAAAVAWAGLAAILWSAFDFNLLTPYPGSAALVPVAGAAALIAAGVSRPRLGAGRVLELRPLVALGAVSYSLYLWHWPLLVLPQIDRATPLPKTEKAALVLAALGLAVLTYLFVERPGQRWKLLGRPSVTFGVAILGAGAAIAVSFAAGVLPRLNAGRPVAALGPMAPAPSYVPSNLAPPLARASDDVPAVYGAGCTVSFAETRSPGAACLSGDLASRRTIAIFGDSHAAQWYPAILRIAEARHWRVLTLIKSSCPSVDVTVYSSVLVRAYNECDEWRSASLARLAAVKPFAVVLSNSRDYTLAGSGGSDVAWSRGLERTIRLLPRVARAVVIADTPRFDVAPPICLSEHLEDPGSCGRPAAEVLDPAHTALERAAAQASGAGFVDMNPTICPRSECAAIHGNLLVYRDSNHLSATFVRALTSRVEAKLLPALARRPSPR